MVDWTEEKLAALTDQQVKNLRENAERKGVADLLEKCTAELSRRNALKPKREAKPRSELKEFEFQVSEQIAQIGKDVAGKYDLSEATAKARSEGVKGFKSHKLLDSKGFAKLGGMQRDGSVAIERYISYRRGNDTVYLGVFLPKGADVEAHEFHVIAPSAVLEGGKPVAQIRPSATEKQKQPADSGLSFKDLPSAATAFDKALAKVTA
ncbi:MAG: hypothetical protein HY242_10030 [Afipia sp.]|nr:hypothetical protein [Afipia sp.]